MTNLAQLQIIAATVMFAWAIDATALDEHEKEYVRALSNEAAKDYDQRNYDVALGKFQRAYEAARVPKLAVWCARANVKLGHLVTALELYQQALRLKPNDLWKGEQQQQAQKDAQRELDELEPRIPKMTISLENARPDEVSVTIDEIPVPAERLLEQRPEDPGKHRVVGTLGEVATSETVVLSEGETKQVVLRFHYAKNGPNKPAEGVSAIAGVTSNAEKNAPTPPQQSREYANDYWASQHTWGLVGIGVGASALVLGMTTGLIVAFKYGDLGDKCDAQRICQPRYRSEVDHYETMRTLSTIGFAVAGVATTTGVTLFLTAPKRKDYHRLGVRLSAPVTTIWGNF